ncbi:MAG: glycerate kinase [Thaumarchaeota archaeon]|nr:glycerate kinase [Nitrososphaerota archaeon]
MNNVRGSKFVGAIKNRKEILRHDNLGHRRIMLDALESAIAAVQPRKLLETSLSITRGKMKIKQLTITLDLSKFDKILVVGGGKAGGGMAETIESLIPETYDLVGSVTIPEGTSEKFHTNRVQLHEATHPIPSLKGVVSTEKIVSVLGTGTADSLVLCLISGGGSALMTLPAVDISLEEKIATTSLLLKSGAAIDEINCVRKHLSRIKGGQLVRYANGALVISFILSDIIGNPLESIASGPTVPDPTTYEDALKILSRYGIEDSAPPAVLDHLRKGKSGLVRETPKVGDPIFSKVKNCILGDNSVACRASVKSLKKRGSFKVYYLGSSWRGEARDLGEDFASFCKSIQQPNSGFKNPTSFVWGGEATVTVRGTGKGGRNLEQALAALDALKEKNGITMAFLGTDGIDGFSDAAGAIIDSHTFVVAKAKNLDAKIFLARNDSHSFFKSVEDGLINSGPTGTNVNDIGIALIEKAS